jgi:hypothetical protein
MLVVKTEYKELAMGGKDIGVVLVPGLVQIVLVRPCCKSIGYEHICPELYFSKGRPSATKGQTFVPQTNRSEPFFLYRWY